ncbi:MAG: diguanylate cyclase [Rubrivivax sp.]|nr:diguanylate cyclase [Rubrivivax sp.]
MTPALDLASCSVSAWQQTPDLVWRIVLGIGLLVLSGWTVAQRYFPGQRSFAVLLLVMVGWLWATTAGHAAVDPPCKSTWALLAWPMILAQPVLWALFLHQYVNTQDGLPGRSLSAVVAVAGLALAAAALGNGQHGLLYGPGSALGPPELGVRRMHYAWGPLFAVLAAWGYAWLAVSLRILLRSWRRAAREERGQWRMFALVMAFPVASNLAYVGWGWRPLGGDPTPLSYAAALLGFAWLIRRQQLFTAVPLARTLLFAELPDPVLVLDPQGHVRDANHAASHLADGARPAGQPLCDWPGYGAALAEVLAADPAANAVLEVAGRVYELRARDIGPTGRVLGRLVQLRDVTELRELSLRDPLTGLWNRRALDQRFEAEALHSARTGQPLALALLDLDHFKRINDSDGHAAGDAVLAAVAAHLRGGVRGSDAVFRIGGEEFALLLPGSDLAGARQRVDVLRATLQVPGRAVTLSAGVAQLGLHGGSLDALYSSADRALYAAKAAGRNQVVAAG